jgi:hypothetical protein
MDELSQKKEEIQLVRLDQLGHKRAHRYCGTCNIQEMCPKFNPEPNATCTIDLNSDFRDGVTMQKVQDAMLDLIASTIEEARWLLLQNKSLGANNPQSIKNVDNIMKMLERIAKMGFFGALGRKADAEAQERPKSVLENLLKK